MVWTFSRQIAMGDPAAAKPGGAGQGGDEKELPTEDNIRVVCRFRPLNDSEEKAGSKFVIKFPDDQCASVAVSFSKDNQLFKFLKSIYTSGKSLRFWQSFEAKRNSRTGVQRGGQKHC